MESTYQEFDKFVEDLKKEIYEGSIGIERKEELVKNSYFSQALEQISREGECLAFTETSAAFVEAVMDNQIQVVKNFLTLGLDPNQYYDKGRGYNILSAVIFETMFWSHDNKINMLKLLLEGGAKVDNPVKNVGPKALSRKGIEGKKADIKKMNQKLYDYLQEEIISKNEKLQEFIEQERERLPQLVKGLEGFITQKSIELKELMESEINPSNIAKIATIIKNHISQDYYFKLIKLKPSENHISSLKEIAAMIKEYSEAKAIEYTGPVDPELQKKIDVLDLKTQYRGKSAREIVKELQQKLQKSSAQSERPDLSQNYQDGFEEGFSSTGVQEVELKNSAEPATPPLNKDEACMSLLGDAT